MSTAKREVVGLWSLVVLAGALSAVLSGCPREHDGPIERAGEEIDDGVEDIGEAVDEATE